MVGSAEGGSRHCLKSVCRSFSPPAHRGGCRAVALFVLPPKRPQLNGAVERAQGSWRYEFYACHDLPHRLDRLFPLGVDMLARARSKYPWLDMQTLYPFDEQGVSNA